MSRRASLGFDRRLDREWLDAAAAQAAAGATEAELRAQLWQALEGVVRGDTARSARGKTVTVLNHIWGAVPPAARALRQRALPHLTNPSTEDQLALHWAMMVGTYPLFTDVTAAAGRLLALQGSFTLAHLTRRLVGTWGERSTVQRACQRVVRSLVQWETLRDTATRGQYQPAPRRLKIGPAVALVLLEALLVDAEEAAVPLEQLRGHPALFPFEVEVTAGHVRGAEAFWVHRQGLDVDFVELRAGGKGLGTS